MSDYIFLFDLDATITKEEILPVISKKIGKFNEIKKITETTMRGEIPFKESFLKRVNIYIIIYIVINIYKVIKVYERGA